MSLTFSGLHTVHFRFDCSPSPTFITKIVKSCDFNHRASLLAFENVLHVFCMFQNKRNALDLRCPRLRSVPH